VRRVQLVLLCALAAAGCEEKIRPAIAPGTGADIPSQESWRSTVTFTDSARIRAVLWSGHIAVYESQEFTLLDDSVRVDFYDEAEHHTSRLTARRGRVNDRTRDFEAYDHVVVLSDDGTVLTTERLFWTNATRLIHTDAFVEITSPTEQIRGHGMESDQSLKNYRIFRVTGRAVTTE
jgi:LPS export ABC transporter protein LptC